MAGWWLLASLLGGQGDDVVALVERFCIDCHAGDDAVAGLDLSGLGSAPLGDPLGLLPHLRERVAAHEMPPDSWTQPSDDERARFVAWLDAEFTRTLEAAPERVGRVPLRRLSRAEYDRTVSDLLGIPCDEGESFPVEDLNLGFDNIGGGTSPLLLEKWADAAERLAARAIVAEDPTRPWRRKVAALDLETDLKPSERGDGFRVLYTSSTLETTVHLPRDGVYDVRVRAYGEQAGPDRVAMRLLAGGRRRASWVIPHTRAQPGVFSWRGPLDEGSTRLAVEFTNDYYRPDDPPGARDRNLAVQWLEVIGPLDPPPLPPSHVRLFARDPAHERPNATHFERARAVLAPLASRAWRRPAPDAELAPLLDYVVSTCEVGGSFEAGIQGALEALLISPRFLFRLEADEPSTPVRKLDGYELASRLSYFLWSSMPDRTLFERAGAGGLEDVAGVRDATRRMLRDPRATALAEQFAAQWLDLRSLDRVEPDPATFPNFDGSLRLAMRRETERLFESVLFEQRPIRELLVRQSTWLNARLARHYGIDGVDGTDLRRVALRGEPRGGLLTHASILTVTSNPTRTSPVKRGQWILETLLDAGSPPPPPEAGELDDSAEAVTAASLRERLEQHRADPSCATCHARMDPLGFALEFYDATGRWRSHDGAFAIDATATLPDGRAVDGPASLEALLVEGDAFLRALTKTLLVYALGRPITTEDEPALRRLVAGLSGSDTTLVDIILGVVSLDAFRMRESLPTSGDDA